MRGGGRTSGSQSSWRFPPRTGAFVSQPPEEESPELRSVAAGAKTRLSGEDVCERERVAKAEDDFLGFEARPVLFFLSKAASRALGATRLLTRTSFAPKGDSSSFFPGSDLLESVSLTLEASANAIASSLARNTASRVSAARKAFSAAKAFFFDAAASASRVAFIAAARLRSAAAASRVRSRLAASLATRASASDARACAASRAASASSLSRSKTSRVAFSREASPSENPEAYRSDRTS
jgi:hypothetical protein